MSDEVKHSAIWSTAALLAIGAVSLTLLKSCEATTSRDRDIGAACVSAGGSWVRTGDSFQCIGGAKK